MTRISHLIIWMMVPIAVGVAVTEPMVWRLPTAPGFRGSAIVPLRVSPVPASIPIAGER